MAPIADHVWGVSPSADRVWSQVCGLRPGTAGERFFMVLQAYIDESVDADSGLFVMAGYISTADRWAQFSAQWESLLSQELSDDGDLVSFKMARFAKIPRLKATLSKFHNIINENVIASVSSAFSIKEYNSVCNRVRIAKDIGTPIVFLPGHYSFAVMSLLYAFHRARIDSPERFPFTEVVDFYFDEHSSKSWVISGWDGWIAQLSDPERAMYGSTPRFEDDQFFLPLQAADFRAWWLRHLMLKHGRENVLGVPLPFDTSKSPPIHHVHFNLPQPFIEEQLMAGAARQWPDEDIAILAALSLPEEPFIEEEFPLQKLIASVRKAVSSFRRSRP